MTPRVAIVAIATILAGCATQPEYTWLKPGGSADEWNRDNGQCRAQAFSVPGVSLMQAVLVYEGCMQGKGYDRVAVRR